MTTMTYTFDWRSEEQARVSGLLVREANSRGFWRLVKWAVWGFTAFVAYATVLPLTQGDVVGAIGMIPLLVLMILWVLLFAGFGGRFQAWYARRQDPNVGYPFVATLDDAGLQMVLKTSTFQIRWDGTYKVRETPHFFLVYYSKRCAYYLPKRVLSEDEVSRVRDLIRTHLPPTTAYEGGPAVAA